MRFARFIVGSLLFSFSLIAGADDLPGVRPMQGAPDPYFAYVVRSVDGKSVCTDATPAEALSMSLRHGVSMRVFGEGTSRVRTTGSAGLNIILRGTAQLDANPSAKAAFERAAEIWESRIADPLTIYVDVDFGTTRFGEPFPENVIASANSRGFLFDTGAYPELRPLIQARANNASETAIYNLLPTAVIPTDKGPMTRFGAASVLLRVLTVFDAVADENDEDTRPEIGFNSAFPYDFDPSNGISPGSQDFEGVVVHEIGHFLGFGSRVGSSELGGTDAPSVMDIYRFRPGVTNGTFGSAQRILSTGGSQVFFAGSGELPLSTGNPAGDNGDDQQASHWKADEQNGGLRIGVMDPTLSAGVRSELTANDLHAFGILGYDIVTPNTNPAPAAPTGLTATGTSQTQIRLNWTDNSNIETEFRIEQKFGATFTDIGSAAANATQFTVGNLSANQTATFRVRARGAGGDSAYTNEATGTTHGPPTPCVTNATTVCLLSNRFRVSINYVNPFSNPPNQPGTFLAARLNSQAGINPDTALFGFSSAQAVEVVVRLQDTRPFAPRFDVYYGGMTDVGYTVTVTDTQTGTTRTYNNVAGTVGGGVDRSSFPASALGLPDRLITSGGKDSFPAEMELGQSFGKRGKTLEGKVLIDKGAPAFEMSVQPSINAGGGAACAESEPNNNMDSATTLTIGQPCTGNAAFADLHQYEYDDSPVWKLHDIYKITTGGTGTITANLSFGTPSADLDIFLFNSSLQVLKSSAGETTTESFTSASLPAGTYYIGVSAFAGSSPYTLTGTGVAGGSVPAAPSNLTATGISTSQIRLNWTDNSNNETEFRVEQKVPSGFTDLGSVSANSTQVPITMPNSGQTATFRVRARNSFGDSPYSNEATGTTIGPCVADSTTVCLLSNRFRVRIEYVNPFSNPPNQPGTFLAARLNSQAGINPDTALFGFSSAQAVEVVVRIQDTRPFAPRYDVYYGGMTDVGYTVTVTDTQTGTTRTYSNTAGTVGGGVDRSSFPAN